MGPSGVWKKRPATGASNSVSVGGVSCREGFGEPGAVGFFCNLLTCLAVSGLGCGTRGLPLRRVASLWLCCAGSGAQAQWLLHGA